MGEYCGVKFIGQEHRDSLIKFGYCALVLTKEERNAIHPEIGDIVHFLIDNTSRGRRIPGRLIADQEQAGGGCISIYVAAAGILPAQKE